MGIEQKLTAGGSPYTIRIYKCVLETQDFGFGVVIYFIYLFME